MIFNLFLIVFFITSSYCSYSPLPKKSPSASSSSSSEDLTYIRPPGVYDLPPFTTIDDQDDEVRPAICGPFPSPNKKTFYTSKAEIIIGDQRFLVSASTIPQGETDLISEGVYVANNQNILHFSIYNREYLNPYIDPNDLDNIIFEVSE